MLPTLVFIHIPKCGGNSVEAKLKFNNIPFTRIEPGPASETLAKATLITGHLSYDQFEAQPQICFFSVVRDPLQRAVSQYFYNLKIKNESPEYEKMKNMSLADYLKEHNNTMCIHMFGRAVFNNHYSNEKLYRLCMEIMRSRYLFVGNISHLNYTDTWLGKMFGCRPFQAHENRNTHPTILPEKVKEDFMARNAVDYMVYHQIGTHWENPDLTQAYATGNAIRFLKYQT